MFYKILKIWAQLAFRLYFRRIFIQGKENIPKKGPVIFLVNHPNSFLEACIIAAYQHRDLHFLVRGDMFDKKWLLPILKSTYQIPIFRFKDGFGKLRNNKSTFDQSFQVLSEGNALLLFPEASSMLVKYLRPLQKGASRLAIGTLEEKNVDSLTIIPTGIYYIDPTISRNDVYLKFGSPIDMKSWYDENKHLEDKLTALTAFFQEKMEAVVISISHINNEKIYDQAFEITEKEISPYTNAGVLKNVNAFSNLVKFITKLNQLSERNILELGSLISQYIKPVQNIKSIDASIRFSLQSKLIIIFKTIFCFAIGISGFLVYLIPLAFSKAFAKIKIKHLEFYAPVRLAISMGTHLLTSIVVFLILTCYFNIIESLLLFIFIQFSLFVFGLFIDFARYTKSFFDFEVLKSKNLALEKRQNILSITNTE
ncbi:MAG: 1-acyl-sn-glycerol-3-phosphate acyltransferase [Saprospiraceae bacterium]|nr:1-acyl-sn-glycerol-3-phosphate acyltransferase [Saprospiraceae bacterium]MBK9722173.1 1-acyl-sn-glycerol-3-phosphate acyltransferase [Saprospiraceae bacterium]